jgi:hypothetical protein
MKKEGYKKQIIMLIDGIENDNTLKTIYLFIKYLISSGK